MSLLKTRLASNRLSRPQIYYKPLGHVQCELLTTRHQTHDCTGQIMWRRDVPLTAEDRANQCSLGTLTLSIRHKQVVETIDLGRLWVSARTMTVPVHLLIARPQDPSVPNALRRCVPTGPSVRHQPRHNGDNDGFQCTGTAPAHTPVRVPSRRGLRAAHGKTPAPRAKTNRGCRLPSCKGAARRFRRGAHAGKHYSWKVAKERERRRKSGARCKVKNGTRIQ